MEREISEISDEDMPSLFRIADQASQDAQWWYLLLVSANLTVLVVASVLASIQLSPSKISIIRWLEGGSVFLFALGATLTIVLQNRPFRDKWYDGRSIAESVKTISWRYMMKADPYGKENDSSDVDSQFLEDLRGVLREGNVPPVVTDPRAASGDQITSTMRQVRAFKTAERWNIYKHERIDDQKNWYSNNATKNRKWKTLIFAGVVGAQIIALVFSIATIVKPTITFDPGGVIATIATALLAWLQAKRYEELSKSYSVAAQDLGMVADEAKEVNTEEQLTNFVADAENAISREHTLWLARRDHLSSISERL
ncbi:DUF4231 domain-containing protein [Salinibacter altiplanensis]|uniref:DUF4231 domain-containing protein n=1 Tax=Salinibacter altiplanensis TaxID=1803181 RepID=UPI000C9FE084|nr:DUF4231 domain-containing protein [Salinibacter altiplanensis]